MASASTPMPSERPAGQVPRGMIGWLYGIAALVFAMVVVGGITRLTESGLSITEWQLVTGTLPPLTDAQWVEAFEKYKQIPEYIEINGPAGMTLADYKFIYFWEWVHRLLGRLVGVAFALPLLWWWVKGQIPAGYKPRLVALLALGGFQGALGWYMVASGLADRTDVSHFRLSAHLLTALFIMAGLVWTALDLRLLREGKPRAAFPKLGGAVVAILFIQLLLGAWVAGLDAGYVARDWPLMQGRFFPDGVDWSNGALYAFTHDPFLLHWLHRWWAWITVAALIVLARAAKKAGFRKASIALHTAFGIQIILGIGTVQSGMNIIFAVLHQAVGALVVLSVAWCLHVAGRRGGSHR